MGSFYLWNPEYNSRNLETHYNDWNPEVSSTDKNWNAVPEIWNPRCGIQNPRLSWIPLHGAKTEALSL